MANGPRPERPPRVYRRVLRRVPRRVRRSPRPRRDRPAARRAAHQVRAREALLLRTGPLPHQRLLPRLQVRGRSR
ncbi:MAG: hypothetical protein FJ304_20670 [Planctomycetes bacterium]|nr:hypothetical protein [Planctomycetota bacterium]